MTAISSAGLNLLDRIGASRAALASPPGATIPRIRQSAAVESPTRISFGKRDDSAAVYGDPRAGSPVTRVWSSPVRADDTVSALMARNRGMASYNLGDQWRGLGGALLTRFAETGDDYSQTMVDNRTFADGVDLDSLSPAEQAQRAADLLAAQTADLAGVATNAPSAGLKIQTRSGQSVELKISVNSGSNGILGMQVDLKASGAMTTKERAAIEQLADGLDRALEGLGRDDAVDLDLSGLMSFDRDVIAGVDLTATNTESHQVLRTFSLHLGDDKQSIALKGSDGELNLTVDRNTQPKDASVLQRSEALQRTLDRMDSAGDRGHATSALVEQMKSAFKQFQAAAETDEGDDTATASPSKRDLSAKPLSATTAAPVDAQVTSQLSGLADFDASFGGETRRSNRFGTTNEAGQSQYQLSQKTTTNDTGKGGQSVAQTVSEQLSADFRKAPGDAMLDVRNGNYSTTRIRDSRTVKTLIDSTADRVSRVLRKTDEQQLKTVIDLNDHRVTHHQSWSSQRSFIDRLQSH